MFDTTSIVIAFSDPELSRRVAGLARAACPQAAVTETGSLFEILRRHTEGPVDLVILEEAFCDRRNDPTFSALLSRYRQVRMAFLVSDPAARPSSNLQRAFPGRVEFVADEAGLLRLVSSFAVADEIEMGDASYGAMVRCDNGAAAVSFGRLTPRQREILDGVSQGLCNKEIARRMNIRETTVKVQLKTVYRVLQVRNRTQAALLAQRVPAMTDGGRAMPAPTRALGLSPLHLSWA